MGGMRVDLEPPPERIQCGHNSIIRFNFPHETGALGRLEPTDENKLATVLFLARWGNGVFFR